jgi:ribonuclease BN (tRNA processing enzyme)
VSKKPNRKTLFLVCLALLEVNLASAGRNSDREEGTASVNTSSSPNAIQPAGCEATSQIAVQVLGSGGPLNGGGRASTSYLIWLEGHPAIVVDMGVGSAVNLTRAGASARDVDAILLSHLHPDHVSDLPGFLWSAQVLERSRPLIIVGPAGNDYFPDTKTFMSRLFGVGGAFPVMQRLLSDDAKFHLDIRTIETRTVRSIAVLQRDGVKISAYPVSHGHAPSLAYRIERSGFSIVFAGDQNGLDSGFASFARDADILILHTALSPLAENHPFAEVIGLPHRLGKLAADANAKKVILSHLMGFPADDASAADFSLSNPDALLKAVREVYRGDVSLASDLECIHAALQDSRGHS